MEFWGSDVRTADTGKRKFNANLAKKSSNKIVEKLERLGSYIDLALVADLELKAYVEPFFKRVELVPQRIELDRFLPNFPDPAKQRPLIIHAPTHRAIKGTEYVMDAVEDLQSKYSFDFRLIEGMKHSEAKRLYENADVVVDQLRLGTYGIFAVESMALGKPVITYIREDFKNSYPPSLPIQSASRDTIRDALELIIADGSLRHNLGIKGRKYVEEYHDSIKIAERLRSIYQGL
jgi:glycosyltransferase involved in cell wall biosynthesis